MDDQASRIERSMKPVTEQELKSLGATLDAKGIWTFPDGSKGKFPRRHIAVYSDSDEVHKPCGFVYFEKEERVQ
ncbi:MAG: hypothetical protein ABSA48_07620 [Terracidiphilus sp.]|jgi:hypothetical protein